MHNRLNCSAGEKFTTNGIVTLKSIITKTSHFVDSPYTRFKHPAILTFKLFKSQIKMDHPNSEIIAPEESAREALAQDSLEIEPEDRPKNTRPNFDLDSNWTLSPDLFTDPRISQFNDWRNSVDFLEREPEEVYGPLPRRQEPTATYDPEKLKQSPIDPELFEDNSSPEKRIKRLGKFQLNPNGDREVELKVLNDCDGVCLSFEF